MTNKTKSFPPILGKDPVRLILGTLPSIQSIQKQQYFGNPRNTFWRILFNIYDTPFSNDYYIKQSLIIENKIAIWDVCQSANRKGSLDSAIQNEIPNKIDELIDKNPTINTIIFNGQKAEKLFKKYFDYIEEINYATLLSTSPANASYSFDEKFNNWKQALIK